MRVCSWALVCLFACGGRSGGDVSDDFESISVEPSNVTLTVELGSTAQQPYVVYGVNGDKKTDITSRVIASVSPSKRETS